MKCYFVILNYCTASQTENCIESIRQQKSGCDYAIMVVDNASPDDSFSYLYNKYAGDNAVFLEKASSNLGFSAANNYAFRLIRERNDADFIVFCNSDIIFPENDFLQKVTSEYAREPFHILGPDIFCESEASNYRKGHQSPLLPYEIKANYLKGINFTTGYDLAKLNSEKVPVFSSLKRFFIVAHRFVLRFFARFYAKKYSLSAHENVPVHGSCIVISKDFIEKEEIVFSPETFFYGEEILLFIRAKKSGMRMLYTPAITVRHLHEQSVNIEKNKEKVTLFKKTNMHNSTSVILSSLK